jgi:hypothetical protein
MKYISVRQILDDLLADDMMRGLSLERAVNYAAEFMQVVGMPPEFENKVEKVEIENWRGKLPCDLYEIVQVKDPKGFAYISAEGSFGNRNHPEQYPAFTYRVKGDIIFTSTKSIDLLVSYLAIPTDDYGFPLIPENAAYIRALELYIQKRYFTILFNSGKINQNVLANTQQEYAFYVGQAQSDLIRPSLDQMESIKNMWTTLIPKVHKHADGFKTVNNPEVLKF